MRLMLSILLFITLASPYINTVIGSAEVNSFPIHLVPTAAGDQLFVDSAGRERVFHGVNAVVKGPPWVPSTDSFNIYYSLVPEDFAILSSLGLNVVRLGLMWPGIEPVKGQYNDTYLDEIAKIISYAAQYNVYILLDMHQDILAPQFCGEGLPLWAVVEESSLFNIFGFPFPVGFAFSSSQMETSTGYSLPKKSACDQNIWAAYAAAVQPNVGYQALYKQNNLLQAWANVWGYAAQRFKGIPNVIGFELWNEPWPGNTLEDPLLLIPGVGDLLNLQPAYNVLAEQIHKYDSDRLIFFAGVTWDDLGAGFTEPPGGYSWSNTSVFAFHYYEPFPQLPGSAPFDFSVHVGDAIRLKSGRFLTEFGSPGFNTNFDFDANTADTYQLSWAMWEWKDFCYEDSESLLWDSQNARYGACKTGYGGAVWSGVAWNQSSLQPNASDASQLSRTYPIAVAGTTQAFAYDVTTKTFTLSYLVSKAATAPTEIYVNEAVHYPLGVNITISPHASLTFQWIRGQNRVYLSPGATIWNGQVVSVTITPAKVWIADTSPVSAGSAAANTNLNGAPAQLSVTTSFTVCVLLTIVLISRHLISV